MQGPSAGSTSQGLGGEQELHWFDWIRTPEPHLGAMALPEDRVSKCEQRTSSGAEAFEKTVKKGLRICLCGHMSPQKAEPGSGVHGGVQLAWRHF